MEKDGADQFPQPISPGKPRGDALLLTPEQLDRQAQVGPDDAPFARDLWRELCPPWARGLPDAVPR